MSNVALTIDVEQDVPPYLNTWRGMEKGLPLLLKLLAKRGIRATFFTTGKVAERYPKLVRKISYQHEVACHSYDHERLDKLSFEKQLQKIKLATKILTKVVGRRPLGFRAPNFKTNAETFKAIEQAGYIYDASIASYKTNSRPKWSKLVEIQNTWPSSFLRLSPAISTRVLRLCLATLPFTVLDYHVWEVVRVNGVPFDCRFATGEVALRRLDEVLKYLLEKRCEFMLMKDIAKNKMAGR
jgi:peptidoglycan/xylan/chitin deacetylase (PgdA/CDA1 family)